MSRRFIRPDVIFSDWLVVWFVLYKLNVVSYSPKFALIVGLVDNVVMLALMLMYGTNIFTIVYFILINTLIKIVPLYLLRKETIQMKDVYFSGVVFLVFVGWLYINGQTLMGNIKLIYESVLYNKHETPFMFLFNEVGKWLQRIRFN